VVIFYRHCVPMGRRGDWVGDFLPTLRPDGTRRGLGGDFLPTLRPDGTQGDWGVIFYRHCVPMGRRLVGRMLRA
jgi:hypothetical protein